MDGADGSPPPTDTINDFAQCQYNAVTLLFGHEQRRADLRGWVDAIVVAQQDALFAQLLCHPDHETRIVRRFFGATIFDEFNPLEEPDTADISHIGVIAERGDLVDNDAGTFLVLQDGIVQRQETRKPDPAMVVFDRYAFDLSQFAGGTQAVKYSIRERYLWQLLFPDPKDQYYIEQPGQFRAELHDRLVAPLYPVAFVIIAFAYLGTPRTTRQSRNMSMLGAIGGVALLRLIGFASTVLGANLPIMLVLQYLALAAAIGGGLFVIHRGLIIEPPAFLNGWLGTVTARMLRLPQRVAAS